ncbi:hypothetical protein ACFQ6E_38980 [Streptomyces sp. NPDC056462]|uniref:hypothetical protein n=1 Tax=Streptomyces sp. NPDC056462 TaxID=3345826 RepID=UPI0036C026E6
MQMTEGFATTVASVASAILIAATLEAAAYSKAIQGWSRALLDGFRRKYIELSAMPSSERRTAFRALTAEKLPKYGVGAFKAAVLLILGQAWGALLLAQAAAIVICLRWLADPKAPQNSSQAKALLAIVGAGALVVAVVPFFRVLFSPYGPFAELWLEAKFEKAVLKAAEEGHGDHDLEPRELPSPRASDGTSTGEPEVGAPP